MTTLTVYPLHNFQICSYLLLYWSKHNDALLFFFFCKWNLTFSLVPSQSLFSVPQLSAYMKFYRNFILILSWWNPSVSSHCHLDKFQALSNIALENFISASQTRCLLKHFLSSFYVTGISNCSIYLSRRQNLTHALFSS